MTLTITRFTIDTFDTLGTNDTFAGSPCTGRVDLFFSTLHAEVAQAKRLCATCAHVDPCKTAAIARAEPCGVWGGETFENGVPVQKRPPGRPRTRHVTTS